jgi:hypothetical protein
MNRNIPNPQLNQDGSKKPILLIGPDGRINSFLCTLYGNEYKDRKDINVSQHNLRMSLSRIMTWRDEVFKELRESDANSGNVIASFDLDGAHPGVLADLLRYISASDNHMPTHLTTIFHASRFPETLLLSPTTLSQFQVIEFSAPENYHVLSARIHDTSPLHEYREIATSILKKLNSIDPDELADKLATLERFVDALNEVDGGPLGKEASERGMDASIYGTLTVLARQIEPSGLTKKILDMFDQSKIVGEFFEREVGPLGLAPLKKFSREHEKSDVWTIGSP